MPPTTTSPDPTIAINVNLRQFLHRLMRTSVHRHAPHPLGHRLHVGSELFQGRGLGKLHRRALGPGHVAACSLEGLPFDLRISQGHCVDDPGWGHCAVAHQGCSKRSFFPLHWVRAHVPISLPRRYDRRQILQPQKMLRSSGHPSALGRGYDYDLPSPSQRLQHSSDFACQGLQLLDYFLRNLGVSATQHSLLAQMGGGEQRVVPIHEDHGLPSRDGHD
mmetsp:Transcript_5887/g.14313  ORF Transcript_5887/g.14313 Transcript_5887/m.14313 type:complete len:219 (-) Transcript_5887:28-684(-)